MEVLSHLESYSHTKGHTCMIPYLLQISSENKASGIKPLFKVGARANHDVLIRPLRIGLWTYNFAHVGKF